MPWVKKSMPPSTWQQSIEDRQPTDQRLTDLAFWKISNGHISATGHPIHFMSGSRVGFSGRQIECLYFRLDKIQEHGRQPSCIILIGYTSETVHPIQFVFGSRVKV